MQANGDRRRSRIVRVLGLDDDAAGRDAQIQCITDAARLINEYSDKDPRLYRLEIQPKSASSVPLALQIYSTGLVAAKARYLIRNPNADLPDQTDLLVTDLDIRNQKYPDETAQGEVKRNLAGIVENSDQIIPDWGGFTSFGGPNGYDYAFAAQIMWSALKEKVPSLRQIYQIFFSSHGGEDLNHGKLRNLEAFLRASQCQENVFVVDKSVLGESLRAARRELPSNSPIDTDEYISKSRGSVRGHHTINNQAGLVIHLLHYFGKGLIPAHGSKP